MLHEFLTANRSELVRRCRAKVAQRSWPRLTKELSEHGIPLFLEQLIKTLEMEQTSDPMTSRSVSGPSDGDKVESDLSEIGRTAAQHGRELLRNGFTVEQVVHDYGDLCQAVTDLAFEMDAPISIDEFRTLNRCLDNGIAVAVTEFTGQRETTVALAQTHALNERLGFFAHELRNRLNTATLALAVIRAGNVGLNGATGAVLDRSLVALRILIDRSLTEVRMAAGMPAQFSLFSLAEFVEEVRLAGKLEAKTRDCSFAVPTIDRGLAVSADRDLLFSAVGNVLQNAFKFTQSGTEVSLNAFASGDRILIEVEDHCGGLAAEDSERMFLPFTQTGEDRSGLGLGLSISRRSVEVNKGTLRVSNLPGSGCMFTIDLPRHSLALAPDNPAPMTPVPVGGE